jgi:Domain of unknown function (DUF6968)
MAAELIATRRLRAKRPGGEPFDIEVGIGRPVACGDQEWKCPVSLSGLHERLHDTHGNDSWQALMLAQRLAQQLLGYFLEDGGQLWDADSEGTPVDLSGMFSGGTL